MSDYQEALVAMGEAMGEGTRDRPRKTMQMRKMGRMHSWQLYSASTELLWEVCLVPILAP